MSLNLNLGKYNRRKSIPVEVGNVVVGGNSPIAVQSMDDYKLVFVVKTNDATEDNRQLGDRTFNLRSENAPLDPLYCACLQPGTLPVCRLRRRRWTRRPLHHRRGDGLCR